MSLELLNSYLYLPVGLIFTLSCFPVLSSSSDSCNQYVSSQKRRINAHVSWNLCVSGFVQWDCKKQVWIHWLYLECNTS